MIDKSLLAFIIAAAISFILENVPGAAHAWEKTPYKRIISVVIFLVLPVVLLLAACEGINLHLGATCDGGFTVQAVIDAAIFGLSAYAGSQGAYAASRAGNASLRQQWAWESMQIESGGGSVVYTIPVEYSADPEDAEGDSGDDEDPITF